jgi:GntR family transcriptional regulator
VIEPQSLPAPLYHRAFGLLYQRIAEGTYAPGDQLPTEEELASEFSVSRATVRQAVSELVKRALVVRQQGRGTFVSGQIPEAQPRFVSSLADLIIETKRTGVKSVSLRHHEAVPPIIARRLGLTEPFATVLERTRLVDDQIFAYVVQYFPANIGNLLTVRESESLGVLTALHRKGVALGEASQIVRAQLADVSVAEHLGIEIAAAVLHAERLLRTPDGSPIELVRAWYRADLYEYQTKLQLIEEGDRIEAIMLDARHQPAAAAARAGATRAQAAAVAGGRRAGR